MPELTKQLFNEILMARQRVYSVFEPTPLERIPLPIDAEIYAKREDLSPIHAFKWRGAFNRVASLKSEDLKKGVIAASSGNHAAGVATAVKKLGIQGTIYMPRSTPKMKQMTVAGFGGDNIKIVLYGDHYTEAADYAKRICQETGQKFIHPYDDLATMGGQGTIADEIVMSGKGPFDYVYIPIGGGGMASAISCWLKFFYPDIHIVGVEGVGQASMSAAIKAGKPISLDHVDVFSDGTAVQKAGDLTYHFCSTYIDEFITVTNDELCAGIQMMWEIARSIPEPAGVMGLMGLMKQQERLKGKKALFVVSGSNIDFGQLAVIARRAGIGASRRRYYRFEIAEEGGSLLQLLELFDMANIIEMQYGKTDMKKAWPVIGLEASPIELQLIETRLRESGIPCEDVTSEHDVEFRIIHYEPSLFIRPYILRIEFPERAGALKEFMSQVKDTTNLCYFNYLYSGEPIGRALIGFEFDTEEKRNRFMGILPQTKLDYVELEAHVLERMLGTGDYALNNRM